MDDSRYTCLQCLHTLVRNTPDAQPLYDDVLHFYASMSMVCPALLCVLRNSALLAVAKPPAQGGQWRASACVRFALVTTAAHSQQHQQSSFKNLNLDIPSSDHDPSQLVVNACAAQHAA